MKAFQARLADLVDLGAPVTVSRCTVRAINAGRIRKDGVILKTSQPHVGSLWNRTIADSRNIALLTERSIFLTERGLSSHWMALCRNN